LASLKRRYCQQMGAWRAVFKPPAMYGFHLESVENLTRW
jgi:hypothetical protein